MKKVILTETLFLKKKDIDCEFIRINTSKENYDADYEAGRIQTFISNSNKNEIKKQEHEFKKLRLQSANLIVKNNDNDNDKKIRIIITINTV